MRKNVGNVFFSNRTIPGQLVFLHVWGLISAKRGTICAKQSDPFNIKGRTGSHVFRSKHGPPRIESDLSKPTLIWWEPALVCLSLARAICIGSQPFSWVALLSLRSVQPRSKFVLITTQIIIINSALAASEQTKTYWHCSLRSWYGFKSKSVVAKFP